MNILCVMSGLSQGGAERVMVELTAGWAKKDSVSLLTFYPPERDFMQLNERVTRYHLNMSKRKIWNIPAQYAIVRGIRKTALEVRPDVIISFIAKTNIFVSWAVDNTNIPYILCERNAINRPDLPWAVRFFRKRRYQKAPMLGVQSESQKRELEVLLPRYTAQNIVVLPNPVRALPRSTLTRHDFWQNYGIVKTDAVIAVSLGRLVPTKGYHRLAELNSEAAKSSCIAIFGQGNQKENLERLLLERGLNTTVRFCGLLDNVSNALENSDIFISLSDYEGFPMGISEAMACGLPVLAFDVPGVRDLVVDGVTGYLVPYGDMAEFNSRLIELQDDLKLRKRMGRAAREQIALYNPVTIENIWRERVFQVLAPSK